jgi:hypothetical protein
MHKKAKFALWLSIFLSMSLALAAIVSPTSAEPKGQRPNTTHSKPFTPIVAQATQAAASFAIAERQRNEDAFYAAVSAEIERQAAEAAAQARRAQHARSSGSTGGTGTWACIRAHESDNAGGYEAVNPNGHYGAYQFSQTTWNNTARKHGREDLIGVRPDQASAEDQDTMARWLQQDAGWGQWSTHGMCGV